MPTCVVILLPALRDARPLQCHMRREPGTSCEHGICEHASMPVRALEQADESEPVAPCRISDVSSVRETVCVGYVQVLIVRLCSGSILSGARILNFPKHNSSCGKNMFDCCKHRVGASNNWAEIQTQLFGRRAQTFGMTRRFETHVGDLECADRSRISSTFSCRNRCALNLAHNPLIAFTFGH
jgi:hypothetical protein